MPKKLACPSCGASLKPDAYYCDYCGAFFEKERNPIEQEQEKRYDASVLPSTKEPVKKEETEEDLYKKDDFVSTEEIENSRLNSILISYNSVKNNFPAGIFFVLFAFLLFFGGAVFDAPFIVIIILMILSSSMNKRTEKQEELIHLYKKGDYEKAYQKLNKEYETNKSLKIVKQQILLCYYRLNKKEEAKTRLIELAQKPHFKDVHIVEVANKLNVVYEPKLS